MSRQDDRPLQLGLCTHGSLPSSLRGGHCSIGFSGSSSGGYTSLMRPNLLESQKHHSLTTSFWSEEGGDGEEEDGDGGESDMARANFQYRNGQSEPSSFFQFFAFLR